MFYEHGIHLFCDVLLIRGCVMCRSLDSWYNHGIIAMHNNKESLYYSCEEGKEEEEDIG